MGKLVASGGKGYDVVFVSSPFAEVLNNLGLIEPIDHAKVPNLANLYPEANELKHDPGNTFSVPYTWGTTGLCYRSDLVSPEPTSWNDLLAPSDALKGKVTMLATDRWLLAAGLLAKGYSVNETDPAKLAEVKDALIAAKKTMLAYDDTTFYSKLVSGEALLVHAWDGWCNYGIAENPAIKFVIPKEGSDLWVDTMVVLKASENKDAAFQFINFVLDAKNHAWAAQNIDYKVPNKPAMESLPAEFLAQFPNVGMPVADLVKLEQLRDVGEAQRDYSRDGERDQGGAVATSPDGMRDPNLPHAEVPAEGGPRSTQCGCPSSLGRSFEAVPTSSAAPQAEGGGSIAVIGSAATAPHMNALARARSNLLMAPALAWLAALMVIPCALVLAIAFFRRGIYGGIDYTFTLENFALVLDPLYAGIFLQLGADRRAPRRCSRSSSATPPPMPSPRRRAGCSRCSSSSRCCPSGRTT